MKEDLKDGKASFVKIDVWGKDTLGRGTSWSSSPRVGMYLMCWRSSKGTNVVGREGGEWEPDCLSQRGIGRAWL